MHAEVKSPFSRFCQKNSSNGDRSFWQSFSVAAASMELKKLRESNAIHYDLNRKKEPDPNPKSVPNIISARVELLSRWIFFPGLIASAPFPSFLDILLYTLMVHILSG